MTIEQNIKAKSKTSPKQLENKRHLIHQKQQKQAILKINFFFLENMKLVFDI